MDSAPPTAAPPRRVPPVVRRHWPTGFAIVLLLVVALVPMCRSLGRHAGHLIYPIDDLYGHMAIAKNLVRHGVWGFSHLDGFSSGASSLLWPWLVAACFAVFGTHEYFPLVLSLAAACGSVCCLSAILRRHAAPPVWTALVLVVTAFLAPLPAVAATGMEHCLQILLTLVFADAAVRILSEETAPPPRVWLLPVLACPLVMTRYEGLFIVAVVGLLLLCRRRWGLALALGLAAAAAPVAFGIYSVRQGWYPLPNSLLLKGNTVVVRTLPGVLDYLGKGYRQMLAAPHMLALVLMLTSALVAVLHRRRTPWSVPALWLIITLGTAALHLQFASLGWFFRYEAYLLVLGGLSLGLALLPETGTTATATRPASVVFAGTLAFAAFLFGPPLWQRALEAQRIIAPGTDNIYQQQYQMARFARRYYQGKGVVANDIGAINFLADIRLFDIYGLADIDVLRARRAGAYDHSVVERLAAARDARLIMVYDAWSKDYHGQPPGWVPVGYWQIPNNVVCGSPLVTFYAPDASLVPELTRNLQKFSASLPPEVLQTGPYRGGPPVHVLSTYGLLTDAGGSYYWTSHAATFFLYPLPPDQSAPQPGTLRLAFWPATTDLRLEIRVNGETLRTETYTQEQVETWVSVEIPAPARPGLNTVQFIGHGTPVQPPHDGRHLHYALREPLWTFP